MVVVSHLFLFLWKSFRGRFDSCKSNLPLFGTIISRQSLFIPQKSRDSESFKRTCPLCSEKGGENHGTWSQLSDHYIKERTEEL